jgi:serine/threonine protein kinase
MSTPDGNIGGGDPLLGEVVLERYRVERKLESRRGAGLYLARHLHAERAVAVEIVEAASAGADAVDRFLETSRTVARVGHENVVDILNGGRSPRGAIFVAMEPVEGGSLADLMAAEGPILWDRSQGIVQQIAAALGAAHRQGVVHGDVCPENIRLVPREGRRDFVKLLDFGVARLAPPGAPRYAAPETLTGSIDARADVYGLACVVYHMVTGRPPFEGDEPAALAAKHATEAPAAPTSLRPAGALPAELDAVILRALEKDPEKRWPDMAAFSDAVARCRLTRRQSVRVEALSIAELRGKTNAFEIDARRRRRVWSIASVAAAVVIAIVALHLIKSAPGHVQISTVPADADLMFNGLHGQARSPVVLDAPPGRYTLVVSRAGFVPAERIVEVAPRETVAVPIQLAAVPAPPATAPTAPAAGEPSAAAAAPAAAPAP